MKRLLLVAVVTLWSSAMLLAATPHAALIPVTATHRRAQRHRAHKATMHRHHKHRYRSV